MVTIESFEKVLNEVFSKSIKNNLDSFLLTFEECEAWNFISDYCLDNNEKNDVIAFSLMPYIVDISSLQKAIRKHLPKDIKNTQIISQNALSFLKNIPFIFNIAFIIDGKHNIFGHSKQDRKKVMQEAIDITLLYFATHGNKECLTKLNRLRQKMKAKSFNCNLYENIYLTAILSAYVGLIFTRLKGMSKYCWFPDRDAMSEYCDRLLDTMHTCNYAHFLENNNIDYKKVKDSFICYKGEGDSSLWYDDLIKLPDYIAGTLASWNIKENSVHKDKHLQMLEKVCADNPRLFIVRIRIDDDGSLQSSRIDIIARKSSL